MATTVRTRGAPPRIAARSALDVPDEPRVERAAGSFAVWTAALIAVVAGGGVFVCALQAGGTAQMRESIAGLTPALALLELGFLLRKRKTISAIAALRYLLATASFLTFSTFVLALQQFPGVAACHGVASLSLVLSLVIAVDERASLKAAFEGLRNQHRLYALERQNSVLRLQGHVYVLYTLTALLQRIVSDARLGEERYRIVGQLLDELTGMRETLESAIEQNTRLLQQHDEQRSADATPRVS